MAPFWHAIAKGPGIDLIGFISNEDYNKVKKQGYPLKKITGTANSKIGIIIRISPVIKNTYDISTIITGVNATSDGQCLYDLPASLLLLPGAAVVAALQVKHCSE